MSAVTYHVLRDKISCLYESMKQ